MNIVDRLAECEQKFEQFKAKREEHLAAATECLTEMNKLQGEYRLLQEMQEAEQSKVNKKATTVEAVAEGETK